MPGPRLRVSHQRPADVFGQVPKGSVMFTVHWHLPHAHRQVAPDLASAIDCNEKFAGRAFARTPGFSPWNVRSLLERSNCTSQHNLGSYAGHMNPMVPCDALGPQSFPDSDLMAIFVPTDRPSSPSDERQYSNTTVEFLALILSEHDDPQSSTAARHVPFDAVAGLSDWIGGNQPRRTTDLGTSTHASLPCYALELAMSISTEMAPASKHSSRAVAAPRNTLHGPFQ